MSNFLASVVITSFNQRRYIAEAIESALQQNLPNIQVIVVDDGSVDGSPEFIAKHFGKNITFLSQFNQGPSAAVNAGLAISKGHFIALLGGDDICKKDRISKQIDYLDNEKLDLVFCLPEIIDGAGIKIDNSSLPITDQPFIGKELLSTFLTKGNFLCAPSCLFRRSVLDNVGYFRLGLIQLQDFDYWIRCAIAGLRIGRMDDKLVSYRRHFENLSSESRAFASEIEEAGILDALLETPSCHKHLRIAFKHILPPTNENEKEKNLSELDKILISLAHPNTYFRSIGAIKAMKMYESSEFRDILKENGIIFPVFLRNCLS